MAVQLYIGTTTSGYYTKPHATDYHNAGIVLPSGVTEFVKGRNYTIGVLIQNHGNTPEEDATVRLYWSDPTTAFLPSRCCRINEYSHVHVDMGTDSGQGTQTQKNFLWTPNACVLDTNGGAVGLLAQVCYGSTCPNPADPTPSDPLSAVSNVQVVATATRTLLTKTRLRSKNLDTRQYHFAFAATNPFNTTERTKIVAKDLSLGGSKETHECVLRSQKLRAFTHEAQPETVTPIGVHLHLGIERVMSRRMENENKNVNEFVFLGSRIGHTGVLSDDDVEDILFDSKEETPSNFELRPYESRQVILGVIPKGKPGDLHVIELEHSTLEGTVLGSMLVTFVVGEGFNR